jgi:hypothetical protein
MANYTSKSVVFGGTDEYVTMGNILAVERTDTFSYSFWFKTTAAGYSTFLAKGDFSTGRGVTILLDTSNYIAFWLTSDIGSSNYIQVRTNATYNDGIWHHFVVTYDGSSSASGVLIYIDGAAVATTTVVNSLSATTISTAAFHLGVHGASLYYYVGSLDEVSVYSDVLSAAEVTWIYNGKQPRDLYASGCPSNLVAWWRMGEGSTFPTLLDSGPSAVHPTVQDIGGSNLSGTMTNMAGTDIVAVVPGGTFAQRSIQFNSVSSQYVTFGNVLAFERTQAFSYSYWFKTSSVTGQHIAKVPATADYRGYRMALLAGGNPHFTLTSDEVTANSLQVSGTTASLADGNWHHIVWTYAGTSLVSGVKCYVDGVAVAMSTVANDLSGTIVTTTALDLASGGDYTASWFFTGNLDEVSVYNRLLTEAEAAWIYNSGVPRDLKQPEAPTMLVAYWRLGENAYPGTMTNMEDTDISNNTVHSNAAPVLDYTWRFKNNLDLNTTGTRIGDFRQLLLAMKNALKTASGWTDSTGTAATLTTPWTVVASSNGTLGGTGLTDYWTLPGDLIWAASPTEHSWIVLRQTGINGQNLEICIDLNIAAGYQMSLALSNAAGFDVSSPTPNNRPTASDEFQRYSATTWTGLSAAFSGILNVAVSDGGECTRIFLYTAGVVRFLWTFDKPKNPVTGWTNPAVLGIVGEAEPLYTIINAAAYMAFRANSRWAYCFLATEFYVDGCIGQRQTTVSDVTAEWPITRMSLVCSTGGTVGRHGEMSDMWYGDITLVNGDTYPAVAPLKQFVQVGDIVLPWDRSVPVMT